MQKPYAYISLTGNAFFCLLIILLFPVKSGAQSDYQFEHITEADGLSDNRITCFFKDRSGYMWIGTENGLNRYDGRSFVIYNSGFEKHSLSNPYVTGIGQDRDGRLWVATQNGLNVIDVQKDSAYAFLPQDGPPGSTKTYIPNALLWDVLIDKTGKIWLAADSKDLYYYDPVKKLFFGFPWNKYLLQNFPLRQFKYNSIRKLYFKSDTVLWLGTSAGLFSFDIASQKFTHYPSEETDNYISLQQAADKTYILQSPLEKLQILDKDFQRELISIKNDTSLQTGNAAGADKKLLWFPSAEGLLQVNISTGQTKLIKHITDNNYSLPAGNINTVYRDNAGLVWVGTDNGVGKFDPAIHVFNYRRIIGDPLPEKYDKELYKINSGIRSVYYDEGTGKYYACSPRFNCFYIIDNRTGKKDSITNVNGVPLTGCSFVCEGKDGLLWILTATNIFRYDKASGAIRLFTPVRASGNARFVNMIEDDKGNAWFACMEEGLYCYNKNTKTVWKPSGADGFKSRLPTVIHFDRANNRLLIGTFDQGLYEFSISSDGKGRFNHTLMDSSVSMFLINDITADHKGQIWVAAYSDGISLLSGKQELRLIKRIMADSGLPDNNVYGIRTDQQGNIWAITYKGLSKFNANGRLIRNYDRNNGMNYTGLYYPPALMPTGEMIVPAEKGFIEFRPDNMDDISAPFPVVINSIWSKQGDRLFDLDIGSAGVLDYESNEIRFVLAALNYFAVPMTKYSYVLEGLEKNYRITDVNTVSYNNLPSGSYTFKVRAIDFNGNYSANEARFDFRIRTPWWRSWWFISLLIGTVVSAVILTFSVRIRNIRRKAKVDRQITELKARVLRAQMNPHFVFNSLNAIQELIVTENYQASYQYLSKFSKLLRIVLDVSEKNFIPLSKEIGIYRLYLELESLRFKHSFHYAIDTGDTEPDLLMVPTLLAQPFIENAIWHGLMHKDGEKMLVVKFEERDELMICSIIDNGIGREKALAIKSRKLGSSHIEPKGMELAMQRMETLRAAGMAHAAIEITDNTDSDGNPEGTRVSISISLNDKTDM